MELNKIKMECETESGTIVLTQYYSDNEDIKNDAVELAYKHEGRVLVKNVCDRIIAMVDFDSSIASFNWT